MSEETRVLAGVLLLALVTVETGGLYLLQLWRSRGDVTDFQMGFARAGHAHAGVLLVLSLTVLLYADTAGLSGIWNWLARTGVPVAAILMPAGFFFSSMGQGRTQAQPTRGSDLRRRCRARAGSGQPRDRTTDGLTALACNPRPGSCATSGAGPGATRGGPRIRPDREPLTQLDRRRPIRPLLGPWIGRLAGLRQTLCLLIWPSWSSRDEGAGAMSLPPARPSRTPLGSGFLPAHNTSLKGDISMRNRNSKRVLAVATVTALLSGVGVAAFAVDDAKEVRQADFIAGLADTRSAGHVDFLAEGLHVYTDDAGPNAKASQYFEPRAGTTEGFPDDASQDWFGTTPEPGKQIVFDVDGDRGQRQQLQHHRGRARLRRRLVATPVAPPVPPRVASPARRPVVAAARTATALWPSGRLPCPPPRSTRSASRWVPA